MNSSDIAIIITGASVVTALAITLIYHAGRNAQAKEDEETIETLLARLHNLTIRGI